MAGCRGSFRYPVGLPARVHDAADAGSGHPSRSRDLSRTGLGLVCDGRPALVVGAAVRVTVYDTVAGRPLARQWSGRVAHAQGSPVGFRIGVAFDWPTGAGARPPNECPSRLDAPGPATPGSEEAGSRADRRALALALTGFAADQLVKTWADSAARPFGGAAFDLIPDLLAVVPVVNPGAVASLGAGLPLAAPACALAGLALAGLWAAGPAGAATRPVSSARALAAGLVAAGLLGNSADRLVLGHVRDFLVCDLFPRWAFNLADLFLLAGVLAALAGRSSRTGDLAAPPQETIADGQSSSP